MSSGPLELFDRALRADAARPYVTYVDPASGARVELSGTTLDNWVAKTANLLRDDLDLDSGSTAFLAPTHHWLTHVFLLGAWRAGIVVTTTNPADADIVVADADEAAARNVLPQDVLALTQHPLGLPGTHGSRIRDFAAEVRGQADRFVPYAAVVPNDVMLVTPLGQFTAAELVADAHRRATACGLDRGDRILVTTALTSADAIAAGLLAPLAAYGSIVMARNLGEPPDVGLIANERVSHVMAGESPWEIRPLAR